MNKRLSTKARIIECGLEVMRDHGYNGTGVKDIVDAASVPKGSFYNYFASKEAFALEAIEAASAQSLNALREQLAGTSGPVSKRLQSVFEQWVGGLCESDFCRGCFLGTLCQEMAGSEHTALQLALKQALDNQIGELAELLETARSSGELPPDTDPAELAEFVFNAWEGALMRVKATRSRAPLAAFLHQLPRLIAPAH